MFKRVSPTLHVSDALRSLAFFEDCLGFDCQLRPTAEKGVPGPRYAVVRRDSVTIHLLEAPRTAGTGVCYITVGDARKLYVELVSCEVAILRPLAETGYGTLDFSIADPDGNRLDFGQMLIQPASAPAALS